MIINRNLASVFLVLFISSTSLVLHAECSAGPQDPVLSDGDSGRDKKPGKVTASYELGPDDQVSVSVPDLEESFTHPARIDLSGEIDLPLVGRLHAAGLTTQQLQSEINDRLRKYLKEPASVVMVTEFHSQPVSVLGEVMSPGIHQIQGRKTLYEVLSLAGGLRPTAGSVVNITRDLKYGAVPLPGAHEDSTGRFSVASVNIKSIMGATQPSDNIAIKADDVVSVPRAQVVYAIGSVVKPGAFVLGENESLSALKVLAMAEGLQKAAAATKAKILRSVGNSSTRTEVAVNLRQLMAGKAADVSLQPNDILFVPSSAARSVGFRSLDAIVQAATGVAAYGRF